MADDRQTTSTDRRRRSSSALTAAVLDPRSGDGWWVLHDLAVPGADHVVVTPGAVWVVASTPGCGAPSAAEVDALGVGASLVERRLATSPIGAMAVVRAVLCGTAGGGMATGGPVGAVEVVGLADLPRLLAGTPARFTPRELAHLAALLDDGFANRRGAGTSLVRPAPGPPASDELPALHPSGRVVRGPSAPGAAGRGPARVPAATATLRDGADVRAFDALRRLVTAGLVLGGGALAAVGLQQLLR
ncbi:MAG TPA: hypothetical protein VFP61_15540 [Acidimicrobiales bacterium]|nr:hypothetical protein [Acidimicrobiales bacterium]